MSRTTAGSPWGRFFIPRWPILLLSLLIAIAVGVGPVPGKVAKAQNTEITTVPARPGVDYANPLVDEQIEQAWHPDYLSLATGDPNLTEHGVYAWPYDLDSIGWIMQAYQNYGYGYFHHGTDMMKTWGTQVFNRSGGQVVNIENYQPGNYLYWEVAVLDPDGYIWQYHHIDEPTIPQFIWDKYNEYLADPVNGGFIMANTYIGNNVEWPIYSFHHIHVNILAAGGVFVNGFEFHVALPDTSGPEIQSIGLLQNGQILPGNTVEGDYSLYVRTRDLILSNIYYLPPYEIKFAVDGGPEQTTWRFDQLPGGADDTAFLDDFYVVPPTCGDYECRDYYIDLGFIPNSQYEFPATGGEHTVLVTVSDYAGNTTSQSFTYTVIGPPPGTVVWQDDFESDKGWVPNPEGGDTATSGAWERADPQQTYSGGPKQLGTTPSGLNDLVTGHLAGANATVYDVDGGVTTIRSPEINLPVADSLFLSVRYYLAHGTNSSNADYLRVTVEGTTSSVVFEELGAAQNDDGVWALENADISAFGGQAVHILVAAADEATESLVEAAIDDVLVISNNANQAPVANAQTLSTDEDTPVDVILSGSDPEGDPLTFTVVSSPTHGTLAGTAPDLTYIPYADFNGADSFTFVVNDGLQDSAPATVSVEVLPVNDAPLADPQTVITYKNRSVAITLSGSDVDGDPLTFTVLTIPEHGSLSGTGASLVYTPEIGYMGQDSFTFAASDGQVDSLPALVSITVHPALYLPLAVK